MGAERGRNGCTARCAGARGIGATTSSGSEGRRVLGLDDGQGDGVRLAGKDKRRVVCDAALASKGGHGTRLGLKVGRANQRLFFHADVMTCWRTSARQRKGTSPRLINPVYQKSQTQQQCHLVLCNLTKLGLQLAATLSCHVSPIPRKKRHSMSNYD